MYLKMLILSISCVTISQGISCYECVSHRDFRCLDPFDYQPFPVVDCDTKPFVRDKSPVFCEKRTEIINGEYVITRGCSVDYRWEDVQGYRDVIGGQVPCIRRRNKETCLCSDHECNGACSFTKPALLITFAASLLAMLQAL